VPTRLFLAQCGSVQRTPPACRARSQHSAGALSDVGREAWRRAAIVAFSLLLWTGPAPALLCGSASWSGPWDAASARELEEGNLEDIPLSLSASDSGAPHSSMSSTLRGANGKKIADCASRCITTCVRGGSGAPGFGPLTLRSEAFKPGFRSRSYCVSECVDMCGAALKAAGAASLP